MNLYFCKYISLFFEIFVKTTERRRELENTIPNQKTYDQKINGNNEVVSNQLFAGEVNVNRDAVKPDNQ